ncbi:GAF domain-containing protein [Halosimplex pelagicum]|uniref:histidine kinase n=1 Tax=Halosimplex pelagicum TaxID=869886 RepID=A0A7D5PF69_9EURY|nr:GAF domain-containing protein [Halosimplex pelagicum]QLH82880.1 GAF domain-containing protein [Halosimplex pelagicum]
MNAMGGDVRVLHVDDDEDLAAIASDYLERESDRLSVATVTDPERALERVRSESFDCVVSDYQMPGMCGFQLLEAVRGEYPDLPFILFTGKGSEEVASEAVSAGVTDYLQKETGTEQYAVLANRVENAVAAARAEERAERQERITALVRDIDRRLVEADTVAAVDRAVCEAFADSETYRFAWIGEPDPETGEIAARAAAGGADEYLDGVTVRHDDTPRGRGPAGRAARTGEVQYAASVPEDETFEPWRAAAERHGFESVVAVPLSAEAGLHDVLAVYADTTDATSETERAVLAELGDTISEAQQAAETRRRLEGLHAVTRELVDAEAKAEVARLTVEAVRDTLGYPNNLVRLVDDDDRLRPVAISEGAELMLGDRPAYPVGEGTAGRAFADGETLVVDDVQAVDDGYDRKDARASMYVPIGDHGTLSIGDTAAGVFDDSDVYLAEIFAANAEAALDRVEQAETRKRQNERLSAFTSVVSHDLRNPLSVLVGSLPLAEETGEAEHFERCYGALDRMERLIDDLLRLAREGETVDSPAPVELAAVARDAWDTVDTAGADLRVETDATVVADGSRLRQLVENLARNSIEHGGDAVTVTVGDLPDGDGFFVADDGPGVPDDDRERVFESGFSTSPEGTGFGLAIVAEIASAHGWSVSVTDGDAGGARFEVRGVDARE